jgi:Ca-activated chloride channel family protein
MDLRFFFTNLAAMTSRWLLFFLCLMQASATSGQDHEARGVVLDGQHILSLPGVRIHAGRDTQAVFTNEDGVFQLPDVHPGETLHFELSGYRAFEKKWPGGSQFTTVFLDPGEPDVVRADTGKQQTAGLPALHDYHMPVAIKAHQDETYESVAENRFETAARTPLSSFTLNTDDAAYCNVRRFLTAGQRPPKEAVRIGEMVNYHADPGINPATEAMRLQGSTTTCPWHSGHWLLQLKARAGALPAETVIPCNFVLLIDVSGSMDASRKLPLLKTAFLTLLDRLDSLDRVAVVVYAGTVSVALPSTSARYKTKIAEVIRNLSAGGSTAGQAGIELAFKLAREQYMAGGNNRVIMATDGDFNVGKTSDADMRELITRYRDWGIFLTCIGVGIGNYKDSKLETLARWGQGNFLYLDNEAEAQKVFSAREFHQRLFTFVKNARMKVIFNPDMIAQYRLIGYESRIDGSPDSLSADLPGGELGYGQQVTAFYELTPRDFVGAPDSSDEPLASVALQYEIVADTANHVAWEKIPASVIPFDQADDELRFGASVALFGMLLQQSGYLGDGSYSLVQKIARKYRDKSLKESRRAFVKLVQRAERLDGGSP